MLIVIDVFMCFSGILLNRVCIFFKWVIGMLILLILLCVRRLFGLYLVCVGKLNVIDNLVCFFVRLL